MKLPVESNKVKQNIFLKILRVQRYMESIVKSIFSGSYCVVIWNYVCKVAPCSSFSSVTSFKKFLIKHYNVLFDLNLT